MLLEYLGVIWHYSAFRARPLTLDRCAKETKSTGPAHPNELEFACLLVLFIVPVGYWMLRTTLGFVGI